MRIKTLFYLAIYLSLLYIVENQNNSSDQNATWINNIEGTGDSKLDKKFKNDCKKFCPDTQCCTRILNATETITCEPKAYCEIIQTKINNLIYKIVFSVYFGLLFLFCIILFFIFFCLSKRLYSNKQSSFNGIYISVLSLSIGLIIPAIVLLVIARLTERNIKQLFRANLSGIYLNNMYSVNVKEKTEAKSNNKHERMKSYNQMSSERVLNSPYNSEQKLNSIDIEIPQI